MTYLFINEDNFIYGYHTQYIEGALEVNIDPAWLDQHTGKLYLKDGKYYIKQQIDIDRSRLFELHSLLSHTDWKVIVNHELKALGLPAKYNEQQLHETRQAWRDEINSLETQEHIVEWLQVEPKPLPEPEVVEELVEETEIEILEDIIEDMDTGGSK